MKWISALVLTVAFSLPANAQSLGTFHVFPQFVDGFIVSNGVTIRYKSTLTIQNAFSSSPSDCTLRTYGLSVSMLDARETLTGFTNNFPIVVQAASWNYLRTGSNQNLASGYATLTCSGLVYAHASFSLYSAGVKIGEAAVFSSDESFQYRFVVDQTETARLGIAIANNTDIAHDYKFTVSGPTGTVLGTNTVRVGARTSLAKFTDEIVPASSKLLCYLQIQATDFSSFSALGLRFTGSTFSSVPGY